MTDILRWPVRITRIEERKERRYISGSGDTTVYETQSLGWFIVLDCGVSLHAGPEKPDVDPSRPFRLSLEQL